MRIRIRKSLITLVVFAFVFLQASALMAEQSKPRGKVVKLSGDVEVINAKGEKRSIVKADEEISEMDTVVTNEGARIVMLFDDGSLSVLNEKSRLRIEKTNWFSYLGGKIYFTFRKVFGENRRVKTRAATIGVRGTTFVISENSNNDGESVALKEGLLQIESTGPAFEIHKKKVLNEFEQYKLDQLRARADLQNEFEQYKKQIMQEFVEYRREFTLQPNRVINLSGYRIDETAMTEANKADFESFEAEAEDMIKAFRAMSPAD
jgi:hypothetical protein